MTHTPLEEHKEVVKNLAAHGVPQEIIADSLGIHDETFRKYYMEEWREGRSKAVIGGAKKLYEKVLEGDNASLFFYLKTQGGYRETNVIQNQYTDTNGKDLHTKDKEILENAGIKTD